MDLLGQVAKMAMGSGQQSQGGGLAGMALQMLMNQGGGGSQQGGLGGLLGLLNNAKSSGLGSVVDSWVGTGPNQAIRGDQISSLLGGSAVADLAEQAGVSEAEASTQLADILPGLVDKLTPSGRVPEQSDLMSTGMSLLQGLMGR